MRAASGPLAGGSAVTIRGTGFTGATAVDFGTTAATNVTVVNDTSITATSPAGTGTVDVTVTTPAGTSPITAADHFTFLAVPTVTALNPTSGTQAGGTPVTITRTAVTRATALNAGATVVSCGLPPEPHLVADTDPTTPGNRPAGAGPGDVTVGPPAASPPPPPADHFTYTAVTAPAVTGLNPTTGPLAGGTVVTIT